MWKSARPCGAKHISKSKCTKHTILGPLLEVEMSKKCTPWWREAHFEVKMYKTPGVRTTVRSWDVEKVHTVMALSTFWSQNVQNTPAPDFWKLRCRKSVRRCGAKHISKSKSPNHTRFGPLLEVEMSKKCTPLWREAHFQVKRYKTHHSRTTFGSWDVEKVHAVVARSTCRSQNLQNTPGSDHCWKLRCRKSVRRCGAKHMSKSKCTKQNGFGPLLDVQMSFRVAGARDCAPSQKWVKTWGFCSMSKNDGRRGKFEEDLQRCIFRGRRSTKDMFIRDVMRSGRWFPETGCILEHQIFRFAEMILRDRCSTSYDLASLLFFRGRCNTLDRWNRKIAKRTGTRPSALHSTFHVWRKFRRILSFLMLSTSKNEEVSQNCFVFDVVKLTYWGSLAELLRFCFVFDVVKFKHWGSLAELLRFGCCQVQSLRTSRKIASFSILQIDR